MVSSKFVRWLVGKMPTLRATLTGMGLRGIRYTRLAIEVSAVLTAPKPSVKVKTQDQVAGPDKKKPSVVCTTCWLVKNSRRKS